MGETMPRKNNPKPEITVEYRHADCPDEEQRIKQAIKIIYNAARRTSVIRTDTPNERRAA